MIFGAALTYDFDEMRDSSIYHGSGEEWGSSHAMVLVGYDDMRQAFKLINSWGQRWGEGGFGWIAYDTFAARANSAFVVEPVANQAPEPMPVPDPAPIPDIPIEDIPVEPVEPDVAVVVPEPGLAAIDPPLDAYACAELRANTVNGRLVVSGFVASQGDLAQLQVSLAGRDALLRVAVHEWPQCEALMTFREQMAEGGGPQIRIVAGKTEFARGETLVLEVTTPSYPFYLYLSYIQASGEVVHLVQPSGPVPSPLPAGQTLIFGDGRDGRTRFVVTPPFG
ncbi:MAG: C1 family peptidase, partial [Alphaproteobacteria bacterium]|nr:C1 family peptidase [Alphaproteobacteria bacterium]